MERWSLQGAIARRLAVIVLLCVSAGGVAAEPTSEAQVKAAFLFRFPNYMEWPNSSGTKPTVAIAVLGDGPVLAELSKLVEARSAQTTRVALISKPAQAAGFQVLYVSPQYRGDVRAVVQAVARQPILVVTDNPQALEMGAMVNFLNMDRRVRFEVSLPAADRAGIRISSELLSVAVRVIRAQLLRDSFCTPARAADDSVDGCAERVAGL